MSCIYKVDGHIIGGIKEFNDFLLKYKTYSDNVSDLVFSKRWDRHIDCLKNVMAHADELNSRYQEAKKKAEYVEGEELLRATRPYIGFSEFFKGQKNEKGDLMAPEFRDICVGQQLTILMMRFKNFLEEIKIQQNLHQQNLEILLHGREVILIFQDLELVSKMILENR